MTATQPNLPLRLAAMASDDKHPLHTLMGLPLEVRHNIFDYVAVREAEPKKLLRYWFEKKEVKAMVAAQDPKASSPHIVYAGDDFESEESEEVDESGSDEGSDYDSDLAEEDDSEGDEDSDVIDAEGDSDDEDLDEEEVDMQDALMAQVVQINTSLAPVQSQPQVPAAPTQLIGAPVPAQISSALASVFTVAIPATHGQGEIGNEDADADVDEDDEEFHDAQNGTEEDTQMEVDNDNEDGHEEAHVDSDEEMVEGEDDEGTTAAAPVSVVKAHRKWRHIPKVSIENFERLSVLAATPLIHEQSPRRNTTCH